MIPTVKIEGTRISLIPSQYQTNELFQLSFEEGATHSVYLNTRDALKLRAAIMKIRELMGEGDESGDC